MQASFLFKKAENFLRDITSLATGDLLVHVEHGIGKYEGLETIKSNDLERDCLKLIYSGNDRLYVPVENIELISRYGSGTDASLDKLGSSGWQARKANAKKRINILKETNDGFIISEEDMKIRGFGDILGFKQSGVKNFKLADPIQNIDLFELAEKEIKRIELENENLSKFKPLIKLYDRADIINDIA